MACDTIKIETLDADEVVSIVTQGPQGPSGAEAATLTTTGDLLYRAALAPDRLPIGTEGQVLKVASGIPAWGAESGAVTSVNGNTGAVTVSVPSASTATPSALGVAAAGTATDYARADHVHAMPSAADVGAAPATGIDPTAITGTAVVDNDARLTDSRTPSSHASSHASTGSDPLAPSDIGAQSIFVRTTTNVTSGNVTLTAARAEIHFVLNFSGSTRTITLPSTGNSNGDVFIFRLASVNATVEVREPSTNTLLASILTTDAGPLEHRVRWNGSNWETDNYVAPHTHAASAITSGTLTHERGGLEADVSAYNGLVKISGGSTSAVGIGTGSTEVAAGDHGHGNLTNDGKLGTTAGLPVVTTTAGAVTTLALGTAGQVLTVNGTADGVEFAAASGGGGEVRFDTSGNYTYTGLAAAGTSESTASWLIRRSEFDGAGSHVATTTANNVEWDDRLTASYS